MLFGSFFSCETDCHTTPINTFDSKTYLTGGLLHRFADGACHWRLEADAELGKAVFREAAHPWRRDLPNIERRRSSANVQKLTCARKP